ncbi:type II CAAX endopeptidase family protein [Desulfitobacterium sp. THU1]|uniref:CPBP family intramembrane glutamic endopeptidase n=1 Tax=Desulfitobacterium sp. THU1 TaxID=3138072 RepID=UPI00311D462F
MERRQENRATKQRLILFVVSAIVLGWATFLLIPFLGLTYGQGLSIAILAGAMVTPTLSSLLTRLITREGFQKMYLRPHFKRNIKGYLLVLFGPTVLLFLSGVVYFLIFPGTFDPELSVLTEMLAASDRGGISAPNLLLLTILQVALLGPVVNIIPTLGEELGWRGYLLPKLRELYSDRAALVITGVIWGIWHLPVIVMGHNYGTEYIGYPWLGILAMIIFCVVLGIVEGYATIKMDSAIPAAMIHSTVNAGAALPVYLTVSGYNPLLGPAMTGLLGGIPWILVALVLLIKVGKQKTESIL